jgi:hypothetical protein
VDAGTKDAASDATLGADARTDAADAAPCGASGQGCCATQACAAPLACKSAVCTPLASGTETAVLYTGSQTWVFDGAGWTQMMVANPTPPRVLAVMSTLNGLAILFGGLTYSFPDSVSPDLNDTWTWDGTRWAELNIASPPPARDDAQMAPFEGKLVMQGGEYSSAPACMEMSQCGTSVLRDTWTFDGTSWSEADFTGPDIVGGVMGAAGDQLLLLADDSYEWSGSSWQALTGSTPPARGWASMAPLGSELVLFGGDQAPCTSPPGT